MVNWDGLAGLFVDSARNTLLSWLLVAVGLHRFTPLLRYVPARYVEPPE